MRRDGRAWTLLTGAAVAGGAGQSVGGAAGALLAGRVGGSAGVAGLPATMLVLGTALGTLIMSRATMRWGRPRALAAGLASATVGAVLAVLGAASASLLLVLVGNMLVGTGQAAVMLSRYAAADLAQPAHRARAMGRLLTATTVGAVLGPNLLAPSDDLGRALGLPPLAGPYAVAAAAFVLATVSVRAVPIPIAPSVDAGDLPRSSWSRTAVTGVAVLGIANLVMTAVMTMAPVHLQHLGTGLGWVGLVISVHIAGMFAPSSLSALLTERLGPARTCVVAAGLLVVACGWAATATTVLTMSGSMLLLGVGWNVALLAGSALVTAGVPDAQRPVREGWGDIGMGVAASGAGAASGMIMSGAGYAGLAVTGAIASLPILVATGTARTRDT